MVKNCNLPFGYIIITGISKPCLCVIWLERKSNRPVFSSITEFTVAVIIRNRKIRANPVEPF